MHGMIIKMQRIIMKEITQISKVHVYIIKKQWQTIAIVLNNFVINREKHIIGKLVFEELINAIFDITIFGFDHLWFWYDKSFFGWFIFLNCLRFWGNFFCDYLLGFGFSDQSLFNLFLCQFWWCCLSVFNPNPKKIFESLNQLFPIRCRIESLNTCLGPLSLLDCHEHFQPRISTVPNLEVICRRTTANRICKIPPLLDR